MIQVIDGIITQYSLPRTGTLKDRSTVSGYHLLGEEVLREEGWLPLEDNPPLYDINIQYLTFDGYEILEDKVVKKYRVENNPVIPEPEIPEEEEEIKRLQERLAQMEEVIDVMLNGGAK